MNFALFFIQLFSPMSKTPLKKHNFTKSTSFGAKDYPFELSIYSGSITQ